MISHQNCSFIINFCIIFTIFILSSSKRFRPRITTSVDHHYWAKGTGFGTGSTTSNWNMEAMTAKQKAEEKYVSLCFAILAEFLSLGTAPHHPEEGVKDESAVVKGEAGEAAIVKSEASEVNGEASESTPVKGKAGEAAAVKSEAGEDTVMEVPSPLDLPDYCTPELAELLSDSCLLPAMASYLLNDSGKLTLLYHLKTRNCVLLIKGEHFFIKLIHVLGY